MATCNSRLRLQDDVRNHVFQALHLALESGEGCGGCREFGSLTDLFQFEGRRRQIAAQATG
jgi:hypothetical protein